MRFILTAFLVLLLFSCSSNREENENCQFLLDIGVNEVVNLNLPVYGNLKSPGNSERVPGSGNGGIIVVNLGSFFLAWDASDPNHPLSTCSVLEPSGVTAKCGCEDANEYNLSNGLPINDTSLPCALRSYRVEQSGNTLIISN